VAAVLVGCGAQTVCPSSVQVPGGKPTMPMRSGQSASTRVKNVILLLADGTAPEAWTLARWVKGESLSVDAILTGAVRTYGADSLITDSAPGATAYATGTKASDKTIAIGAPHVTIPGLEKWLAEPYRPVATLLEGARLSGRATGIVVTSNVQHATPAAFSSHVVERSAYEEIAKQQVYQGIFVVLGGGSQFLQPLGVGNGTRADGENLIGTMLARGTAVVQTDSELTEVQRGPVFGLFAPNALSSELDRAWFPTTEPTLRHMTERALDLLSRSAQGKKDGFFLFVEGSQVDWGAHDNDPSQVIGELLAFDEAVGVARAFAKRNPETLVVVVSDHGTGGLSLGTLSDPKYSQTAPSSVLLPLRRVRVTASGLAKLLGTDDSPAAVVARLDEAWGISDLSDDEINSVVQAMAGSNPSQPDSNATLKNALGAVLSKRARIGWTTRGHVGGDVLLFAEGDGRPLGLWENVEIAGLLARRMGFALPAVTERLFVDMGPRLSALGLTSRLEMSDPSNPCLVVEGSSHRILLPISKNLLVIDGKAEMLEGLVILAPATKQVFAPEQAVTRLAKLVHHDGLR
jgi:alkaline phosphatase